MSKAPRLTIDDRIKRDGERWRYIYFLERELENRKTRQELIRISLALNVLMGVWVMIFLMLD